MPTVHLPTVRWEDGGSLYSGVQVEKVWTCSQGESLYSEAQVEQGWICLGEGGGYVEVQCITGDGHVGPPVNRLTRMTDNTLANSLECGKNARIKTLY